MEVIRSIGKYCGYYIVTSILIALFVDPHFKGTLYSLTAGAVTISFLSAVLSLITGDIGVKVFKPVSAWCLRVMFIAVSVMSAAGIGFRNIVGLFRG